MGQSVKLRTLILNSEYSPSPSSCGYGLCQLLAAPAARTPCLLHVLSPDCRFPPFYQLGHVFPSTSKFSHASHFDCFPWFCELSPSCLHLSASKLPMCFHWSPPWSLSQFPRWSLTPILKGPGLTPLSTCWVLFHCIRVRHLLDSFISQWTSRLSPCPDYGR